MKIKGKVNKVTPMWKIGKIKIIELKKKSKGEISEAKAR